MQAELTLVMFCICHNLPFLLMDFLPFLLRECCADSRIANLIKCGRTKATQLADTLGGKARESITSTMQSSKFSLIVDETTDVSDRKCLVLVVRYFDIISIKDRFLSLLELVQADAKSTYETIKAFFDKNNIPIENLIGLATDGASTMAGELNGLKTKLKRDTDFFYIKCTCHSLHLCSSYACKKLPLDVENLCRKVYNFFAHSSKRIHELKEFQEYCNSEPHKMLGLSVTRWLALEAVVSRIIEQWKPLQLYFLSCALEVNGDIQDVLQHIVSKVNSLDEKLETIQKNQHILSNGQATLVNNQDTLAKKLEEIAENNTSKSEITVQTKEKLDELSAMLPLRFINAVNEMEEKLQAEDFAQAMRIYMQRVKATSEDVDSVIRGIFTDELLHMYNWEGWKRWEKLSFSQLGICKILRDVFQTQSKLEFEKSIKRAISRSHHRYIQKQYNRKEK